MYWLQAFAFVTFVGLDGAYGVILGEYEGSYLKSTNGSTEPEGYNSFPYIPAHLAQHFGYHPDLHTVSIVSLSAGPLCSGFHIHPEYILTAASCVFSYKADNLLVISNVKEEKSRDKQVEYLWVIGVFNNDKYEPSTDEHNVALLRVQKPTLEVPVLLLPEMILTEFKDEYESNAFFTKFSYPKDKKAYFSTVVPSDINYDLHKCGHKTSKFSPGIFLCVSRADSSSYVYSLLDVGSPLIYSANGKNFSVGMFTGHNFLRMRTHHLYQSLSGNLDFIKANVHIKVTGPY